MQAHLIMARTESWPLKDVFTISRGTKTEANVVVIALSSGLHTGHGEAVPYARYGETVAGTINQIQNAGPLTTREDLARRMKPGAALNAIDCALWDLEAKASSIRAAARAGRATLRPVTTAYTISLATPNVMASSARAASQLPLLKLKLGGAGDAERMKAVRAARPDARLIVDANEAWTVALFPSLMQAAFEARVEVIEQPLPENEDGALASLPRLVPLCADESVHTSSDIPRLKGLYDAVNIKLDKAGGLTGALSLQKAARTAGLKIMVGSMVSTSLAVAPAMIVAQDADWVDLDGPLLLARDRDHAITIENGVMSPPDPALWG